MFQDLFLANFAVISLVCCYRFSSCHCLLSGDCEGFSTYAVFNFTELVDVDFGWLFTIIICTFNLDDGSRLCPWSSEEFNLFFAIFCVVAGQKPLLIRVQKIVAVAPAEDITETKVNLIL